MSRHSYSIWIGASPTEVWNVYTDLNRLPDWQTGNPKVVDVTGPGDREGATYAVKRGPASARTEVITAHPSALLVTRTEAYFGLRFYLAAEFLPKSGGTELQLRLDTYWPRGLGVLGKAVEFVIFNSREGNLELRNLKSLVGKEANRRSREQIDLL